MDVSDIVLMEFFLGSDYLEVPYLRGKKIFGGTVPPGKKIIWRYRTSMKKNYLEVPQQKCLVIS